MPASHIRASGPWPWLAARAARASTWHIQAAHLPGLSLTQGPLGIQLVPA